jgi:aryl-alcohol dehydrogenase-like predicted oxidoreductase
MSPWGERAGMVERTFDVGGTDTVERLGFGAMRLCGPEIIGEPADVDAARAVARRAVELGVDLIDTADAYGPGTSERLLAEAIDVDRDDLLVATKGGLLRNRAGDWLAMGDPDYLRNAQLCSADRLGVDRIDLYQLHRPDPDTPFLDSVHALAELRDEGAIRHVGLSNVSVDQLAAARDVVEIATVQNRYNVGYRDEAAVLEACADAGIGFVPWYPLAAGDLDGVEGLDAVASAHDATRHQIALAWLLHRSPVVLPIPGTADPDHLAENVAAAEIDLTDDEVARLTAAA